MLTVARAVLPARGHVFVAGTPSTEGNAVEIVRCLLDRYPGDVVWADAPTPAYLAAVGLPYAGRVRRVAKGSLGALGRYATAEAVFFTHGLYGEPSVDRRKLTVNLWHGDGLKKTDRLFPARTLHGRPSDVVVSQTRLWGRSKVAASGLRDEDLLLTGHPRNGALLEPATAADLTALGIDPARPFVAWMPAFRSARALGTMRSFSDSDDVHADRRLAEQLAAGVVRLRGAGLQVVAKAHPFDAVARDVPGVLQVDDATLEARGVRLYSLLGASAGLISDVSSVWVDYLALDRPIGMFWPDRGAYLRGRGVEPEWLLSLLPGDDLETEADFDSFARDVLCGGAQSLGRRQATRSAIGFVATRTPGHDLLDALASRGGRFGQRVASRGPAAPGPAVRTEREDRR
ncbi:hypothetical protein CAE01nite_22480 [Cellulomonas aerilata]|uniref:Glycosyl transferase n=1 Tax=Cellulomonas aerilata TaxID=515326 RepID=A0A512DDH9_9CELL|nr:hypothetical protein CAE01nite_22480 [Cellulomonas aerilata]